MTKKNWRKRMTYRAIQSRAATDPADLSEVDRIRFHLDLAAELAGVTWSQSHAIWEDLGEMAGTRASGPHIPVRLHIPHVGSVDLGYASHRAVNKSRRSIGRMGLTLPAVRRFCDEYERRR